VAKQATGTVAGSGGAEVPAFAVPGTEHAAAHHSGKPISWIAVVIVTAGFVVGCVGMVPHPNWWLFWVGAAIAVVGCVITLFAKTFSEDWY
jgi:hypothetical protein